MAKTKISATDKFNRKRLVELRNTDEVKITMITKRLPRIPTKSIMEHKIKLVQAMYSGSSEASSTEVVKVVKATEELFMIYTGSVDD